MIIYKGYSVYPSGVVIGKSGKVMSPKVSNCGYQELGLRIEGKRTYYLVHRLIAMLYLPNPLNLPQVNHKDGDKSNNCLSNLEWISSQDNHCHARNSGLKGKLSDCQVNEITVRLSYGESQKSIASYYGVHQVTISKIKRGKLNHGKQTQNTSSSTATSSTC